MAKTFSVRLPDTLHARLLKWAERENRSLNNLIETVLLRAVEADEQERKGDAEDA